MNTENHPDEQREIFSSWLQSINAQLGTSLEFDDNGRLCLQMSNDIIVGLELVPAEDVYRIYTPLVELNAKSDIPLVATSLALNLYQKATVGGLIALDVAAGTLVYSFRQEMRGASAELLAQQLNQVPIIAAALRAQLEAACDPFADLPPAEKELYDEDPLIGETAVFNEPQPERHFQPFA